MDAHEQPDNRAVAVVGGGIAGLTAATYLARAGRAVTVYEQATDLGGRARTHEEAGYRFNFGPHALYRGGVGAPILRDLGLAWTGGSPPTDGYGVVDGRCERLPSGLRSFLTTRLLSATAKAELLALLPQLARLDPAPLQATSVRSWLDRAVRHPELRALLAMLIRVSTYSADLDRLSMGAALVQTRLALKDNVTYLDGGWQTLVDGLRRAALAAGATLATNSHVAAVLRDPQSGAVSGVRLADGAMHPVDAAIVAASPQVARALMERSDETDLPEWAAQAIPVRAACLDVALRALPQPAALLAFGLDRPLYLVVHSAVARLAPDGGAVIHLTKYLRADEPTEPEADERELLELLDLVQPGWRERLVTQRFLPKMVVSHSLVTAASNGLAGRPGPAVPGVPGLYVAGDWVGPVGMLVDGALASTRQAALVVAAPTAQRSELVPRLA